MYNWMDLYGKLLNISDLSVSGVLGLLEIVDLYDLYESQLKYEWIINEMIIV